MKDEYKELICRVRFIDGVPARTYLSDVEIVRCKDCKHWKDPDENCADEWGNCESMCIYMFDAKEDDFCSKAERIDNEVG